MNATAPRWCYRIPAEPYDENGWVPSVVTENEPGHAPLTGKGTCAAPWYWGRTYEQARKTARDENAKLGLAPEDAIRIVISSMRASYRARTGGVMPDDEEGSG
jgi:hypothetical protein